MSSRLINWFRFSSPATFYPLAGRIANWSTLVAVVLMIASGLVGVVLSLLGVGLTPVLGIGFLILPIGLAFLLVAWLIARML